MEISGNSYSQPVNFYTKSTGNNINTVMESENQLYGAGAFAAEFQNGKITLPSQKTEKKKRKSKRLNTLDTDYLPDEPDEDITASEINSQEKNEDNFFIEETKKNNKIKEKIIHIVSVTPLINYFFLKNKKLKIQKTVKELNDITQNIDELLNTTAPFGENTNLYNDVAKNLTTAAEILGQAQKNISK